ncbi:MAG: hypothetical protein ABR507_01215, partial [Actinomycetota bacterium]
DPIHVYGEPDVRIAPNGVVHVSGPQGTGVQRSIWNVSVDNADSFRVVQGIPVNQATVPNKSELGPGGGDTEISISRDNKVFFSDLWALTCFTAASTQDNGASVASSPNGCSHLGADRQWMSVFDPVPSDATTSLYIGPKPLNYQSYTLQTESGSQVDMSTDGVTYNEAGRYGDGTLGFNANDGTLVVDQQTGRFLAPVGHQSTEQTKFGLGLAIGTQSPDGKLTFEYKIVNDQLAGNPGLKFPVLAQDKARNLYMVWTEDAQMINVADNGDFVYDCPKESVQYCFHVYYSYASPSDLWTRWSEPRRIDQPPSITNVFPWVAAGGDGMIDVVWYGTDQRLHPAERKDQSWDVFMSQIDHADTASPHMVQSKVTDHPSHKGDICILGTACFLVQGDRNLADFFMVSIDSEGRARIVFNDTSNGISQKGFQSTVPGLVDHPGAAVVTLATQQTGLNAWNGQPLMAKETTTPTKSITDPIGDALFKPLAGSNLDGFDIKAVDLEMIDDILHVRITTEGDNLGAAALAAGGAFGELVVRWQYAGKLYFAAVE